MQQIGIRELRASLGSIVRRVRGGETVELTEHGHPVARLVPLRHPGRLQQLVAEGRATLPEGSLADLLDRDRRPLHAGERSLSDTLAELRDDER
jgi:prevent-host-death family protein